MFKISPFGRNDKEEVEMTEMAVIQSSRADKSFQLMNTPRLYGPLSDSGKEINGNFRRPAARRVHGPFLSA
ncbi:MAG TPA: hypothetical protein PK936_04965, partial [Smithellaceae bacterium]|nr:hypothetical protein [Smithellaceae bacterium]